jgi:hypothetical protein
MQGFGLLLCRVLSLLACIVCAGGSATSAHAQTLPSGSSNWAGLQDEACRADHQDQNPAGDPVPGSSGSDFAEHDDDDDCSEEPAALVIDVRPQGAPWEPGRPERAFLRAPRIHDHRTLEPRPPRAI